jgi:hypothetical protein
MQRKTDQRVFKNMTNGQMHRREPVAQPICHLSFRKRNLKERAGGGH